VSGSIHRIGRFLLDTNIAVALLNFIKNLLRQKGHPIPENDIWIAASARQHGLTLVTRDGHFGYVEDLITERW
jgi:tRNA(fMet)-specific endonuclease VapC